VIDAGVDGRVDSGVTGGWERTGVEIGKIEVDGIGSLDSVWIAFSFGGKGWWQLEGIEAEWLDSEAEGPGEFLSLPGRGGYSVKLRGVAER
jgi:hypothetical protein